jgi:ubiquinone/menaquinone biosynthesis C-methylase UbiE
MTGDNTQQIQDWNGAVGERWAAEQAQTDELTRPFGEAAIRAAAARLGERVLDVGCGCGDTSLALTEAVGATGSVGGLDVSAPMLAVARQRAVGVANLSFQEGDASRTTLPGSFDLLYSRFGVMFFDDPVAAFAHLRRSMRTGGRLACVCWQTAQANPWASVPTMAARKAAGLEATPADPKAPGPFAFGDAERVKNVLAAAGFSEIAATAFEAPIYLGSTPRSAAEGAARIGPMSRVVRQAGPDKLPAILDAVELALTPLATADGSVTLPGRTWVFTAKTA